MINPQFPEFGPRSGVGEQKLVKFTTHSNPSLLKSCFHLIKPSVENISMQQTVNKSRVLKIKLFIRIVFLTIVLH